MLDRITEFLSRHAQSLDGQDYDTWLEGFEEDAQYRVISAENLQLNKDMPLVLAKNKNMIRDRILSLREANVYNIHCDHHVLGLPIITPSDAKNIIQVTTPFIVHQIDQDGVADLYCVGRYQDKIHMDKDKIGLKSRDVIYENFGVLRLFSTPI